MRGREGGGVVHGLGRAGHRTLLLTGKAFSRKIDFFFSRIFSIFSPLPGFYWADFGRSLNSRPIEGTVHFHRVMNIEDFLQ